MKIDLFSTTLYKHLTENFGIYDNPLSPENPIELVPFEQGMAKINNINNWSIYCVPLDKSLKCIRTDGSQESQCDALLIVIRPQRKYDFYFVELKAANKTSWITDGTAQLKTTILNFRDSYNLSCLSKKMAFLANKSHPNYHYKHTELMEKFRNETGFRLNVCATIPIK
jgi:hypothetical protein